MVETLPAHRTQEAFADGVQIRRARRDFHNLDPSALDHGGESFPELVIVVSNEVRPSIAVRCGLPQLLRDPSLAGAASHIEMDDFPHSVDHEEECENGVEEEDE